MNIDYIFETDNSCSIKNKIKTSSLKNRVCRIRCVNVGVISMTAYRLKNCISIGSDFPYADPGLRHPRDLAAPEVKAFLTMLVARR